MNTIEQTNKIMELMACGLSMAEAIEEVLAKKNDIKIAKKNGISWYYQGDLRCPVCGKYSKLWTNGWRDNMSMRLECIHHGTFYKTPQKQYWRTQEQVDVQGLLEEKQA